MYRLIYCMIEEKKLFKRNISVNHLKIHHVPEPLQVCAGGDLLSSAKVAVVHQATELSKTLLHQ